ncbi:hypothetical protein J2S55_001361 [Streptosporangium brasiliense]|uniref:Membrane transport protein MMPL domain-containing protein n=1 Tax=Streptosporangium brasiliense TaxID=47480 RepID=A0ABT9QZS8_9ACTN|nr:hypothetical protein [Streptosporangium brasiliense]
MCLRVDAGRPIAHVAAEAGVSRTLPAGVSDPTSVFVTATDGGVLTAGRLDGLSHALTQVKGVGQVARTVLNKDHRAARIDLCTTADPQSQQARDLASGPIRAAVAQHTPAGTTAHVGGTAAIIADISTAVDHDLKIVFPVGAVPVRRGAGHRLQHPHRRPDPGGDAATGPGPRRRGPRGTAHDTGHRDGRPGAGRLLRQPRHVPGQRADGLRDEAGHHALRARRVAGAGPRLAALLGRAMWWPLRPRPTKDGHRQDRATEPAPEPDRVTAC